MISVVVESSRCSSKTLRKGSCPYAPGRGFTVSYPTIIDAGYTLNGQLWAVTNIRTHCTDKLCDSPTKYWEESHVSDTHKKLACSQSLIAFSRVSGRYVKHFSDAKVQQFWLALSARSISVFSSVLFSGQYNEQDHITSVTNTVMDILYRQTVIYQQCMYIEIWEESYVFNADIF